jgi:desulfoferrodoxin (superoxide reductase-like protein)
MQLMVINSCLRFELFCQLKNPPVVSEKQDLGTDRQLREDREADPCTIVVKAYENVVDDKGHRLFPTQMLFEGSEAEREVELISGSVAHPIDRYLYIVWTNTKQDGLAAFVQFIPKIRIRPQGELGKKFASSRQNRSLVFLTIVLYSLFKDECSNLQAKVLLDTRNHGGKLLLCLL